MEENKRTKKSPPITVTESAQFDLFKSFLSNDESEVSNAIEIWETIPKYFFTPQQVKKLRTSDGLANPFKWEFRYKGIASVAIIQPALIEQDNGSYLACFPSVTEELVEETLKKILTEQHYGMHDIENAETWVRFSLRMIQKELKARGRSRSNTEVKHAIEVMNKCNISFQQDGKEIWSGSILQDLITVGRRDYLADSDSHHAARLPLFITRSINKLDYRQFNYARLMDCNHQLSRWIYKKLIHRFKQASLTTQYHFSFSSLANESGLLQQASETNNRQKVVDALDELNACGVLNGYKCEQKKAGRAVTDVIYHVVPSMEFVTEQKASNKRAANNLEAADIKQVDSPK